VLRKPAADSGRGIEESSDVNTTSIHESTLRTDSIDNENADTEHDDPLIPCNTAENAGNSVINVHNVKNTLGLTIACAIATAEKSSNKRLHALAKRIRRHQTQRATPEPATAKSTDPIYDTTNAAIETIIEGIEEVEKAEGEDEEESDNEEFEENFEGEDDVVAKVDFEVEEIEEVKEIAEEVKEIAEEVKEIEEEVTEHEEGEEIEEVEEIEEEVEKIEEEVKEIEEEIEEVKEVKEVTVDKDIKSKEIGECKTLEVVSETDSETDSERPQVDVAEGGATENVPVRVPLFLSLDDVDRKPTKDVGQGTTEDNDDDGEWLTIRKGKAVRTSSRPVAQPVPAPTLATSTSSSDVAAGSSSSVPAPASTKGVEVSTVEPQDAVAELSSDSQEAEWRAVRRAEEHPVFPLEPQAPLVQQRHRIVPVKNSNSLETKAERYRKEMEAWTAFKEAERAAERARLEEEERKARGEEEAKVAHIVQFDSTMGRLNELLKAAKEAREEEKRKEEKEKAIKEIDSAQNRIGEMIDMKRVRAMFDPEVLKTSSLSSAISQATAAPELKIPQASSSSVVQTSNASASSSALQQNAANHPGPPRVLPSNWGVRYGTTAKSKTIERRLRRRRNELRRLNGEACSSSSGRSGDGSGDGKSPERDDA
ncbi:hypothetical protein C0995_013689, partial [Termitomyces sp. Mi166